MRESALFLLGLLVAVSVDVARLLVYVDLCARISFVEWNVWCRPTKEGCDGIHRGNTGVNESLFSTQIEKLRRYLVYDPESIYAIYDISRTRILIRKSLLVGKARF